MTEGMPGVIIQHDSSDLIVEFLHCKSVDDESILPQNPEDMFFFLFRTFFNNV